MKHFIFGLCAVLLLTLGPVRVACAQHWWQHSRPGPMGAGADKISKWTWPNIKMGWPHTGKAQLEKPTPIYTSPKSVGWWHKNPAPMGSGADQNFRWTWPNVKPAWPHIRKAQLEKPTPLYTSPKSVGLWQKSPGPEGAGAGK